MLWTQPREALQLFLWFQVIQATARLTTSLVCVDAPVPYCCDRHLIPIIASQHYFCLLHDPTVNMQLSEETKVQARTSLKLSTLADFGIGAHWQSY
jgi:hypothetical protein